jgi:excisionase family DNA binding protein
MGIANHPVQPNGPEDRASFEAAALLTVREVAERLKVTTSWVYQHTRADCGDPLPSIKMGKYLRFEESALREWLKRQNRG